MGWLTKLLADFDKRRDDMRRALVSLKRAYVIMLIDHYATQNLFDSYPKDLQRPVGVAFGFCHERTPCHLSGVEGYVFSR